MVTKREIMFNQGEEVGLIYMKSKWEFTFFKVHVFV